MTSAAFIAGYGIACASLVAWLVVLLGPDRPWNLQPVGEDEPGPPDPDPWPDVHAIVPARTESTMLPHTLPALLEQDYPGLLRVIVVDDRSDDGTAEVARRLASDAGRTEATVLEGDPLPDGWVGKVWALAQGADLSARDPHPPAYLLLTDADVLHAPGSLRRLVAESEAHGLALNSRMARLRCESLPERLLIPPFVFFFNLLYPMRRVNDPASHRAAAAGGCVLVRRRALEHAGGLGAIRGEVIDDVNLAQRIKALGEPIRLAISRSDVRSLREYGSVVAVWRMVRRTAFDELRYSFLLLAGTLAALALLFLVPPLALLGAVIASALGASAGGAVVLGLTGLAAWVVMALAFRPTTRYFALGPAWTWTLPLAGLLYGGMTLDSARVHVSRRAADW